jgi:A/G-specific adenine glycosylase
MELGALLCSPRNPRCVLCPVQSFCRAIDPDSLPRKRPRPATQRIQENYWWIQRGEHILLRRASGRRWKGLWTLPPAAEIRESQVALFQMHHPITKYIVSLNVFLGAVPERLREDLSWQTVASLCDLPMPSPHRRAAEAILQIKKSSNP